MGDVGRIDADGYVHLEGRRTDLIISGGVNVYPLEVENALRQVPGVADELDRHARTVLAPAKRPKDYVRVSELPMTATGKVRRNALPELDHRVAQADQT